MTEAKWLFGSAALFNFLVGLALFFPALMGGEGLQGDPVTGTNIVYFNFTAGLILVFGLSYVCVALDPVKYFPFIWLGALGKLVAIVGSIWPWAAGDIDGPFPYLVLVDAAYVLLFLNYARRAKRP
ncbi:MAG: hypothetical protein RLO08_01545 [Parvibaculaceae bacterium]